MIMIHSTFIVEHCFVGRFADGIKIILALSQCRTPLKVVCVNIYVTERSLNGNGMLDFVEDY